MIPAEPAAGLPGRPHAAVILGNEALELELHELEARLRKQLLLTVESQIIKIIEEPLKVHIKRQLDAALAVATEDLASAILSETAKLVREAVAKAVKRELAELRSGLTQP